MGGITACCRIIIVVINILFLLIGLAFFAGGLFVRFGDDIINGYVSSIIDQLEASIAASGFTSIDINSLFSMTDILYGVAVGMICFGLFLLIITILGICGGCCNVRIMLIIYVIVCGALLIAQIIVIGILYGSPNTFHDPAKSALKSGIQNDFQGLNGTNLVSIAWNIVNQNFKCCGANDYTDFTGASQWTFNYTGTVCNCVLETPLSCCQTLPSGNSATDFSCSTTPTDANNYLNSGCYDTIWDQTLGNVPLVAGTLAGVAVFQLILIIFACIAILCGGRNNKTEPI